MLKAAIGGNGANLWLVIFAVVMAAVSVYYYFRVIQSMYFKEGDTHPIEVNAPFKWTLVVLAGLVILLGIFPNLLLSWLYF
jgi:NADH-quinone oxidoreductase subunit N